MQQTRWVFELSLTLDERLHHYTFEVNKVESGFEVAIHAIVHEPLVDRETARNRYVDHDRRTHPTKTDAMVGVRDFISGLVEESFAPPSIRLVKPV